MTTIVVASVTALVSNKIWTGQYTRPKSEARLGTTIYTKLLAKENFVRLNEESSKNEKSLNRLENHKQ